MSLEKYLFVVGLTFDIVGAFYLAQSFITKDLDELIYEGTSGYGHPPNVRYIKSVLLQKAEAQIGFFLLLFGFSLQSSDYLLTYVVSPIIIPFTWIMVISVVLVLSLLVICRFIRELLFARYARKMSFKVIYKRNNDIEPDDNWILFVAKILLPQLKRQPNEDDESYVKRILSELKA